MSQYIIDFHLSPNMVFNQPLISQIGGLCKVVASCVKNPDKICIITDVHNEMVRTFAEIVRQIIWIPEQIILCSFKAGLDHPFDDQSVRQVLVEKLKAFDVVVFVSLHSKNLAPNKILAQRALVDFGEKLNFEVFFHQ